MSPCGSDSRRCRSNPRRTLHYDECLNQGEGWGDGCASVEEALKCRQLVSHLPLKTGLRRSYRVGAWTFSEGERALRIVIHGSP